MARASSVLLVEARMNPRSGQELAVGGGTLFQVLKHLQRGGGVVHPLVGVREMQVADPGARTDRYRSQGELEARRVISCDVVDVSGQRVVTDHSGSSSRARRRAVLASSMRPR